jgi:hypothetical protein
MKNESSRRSAIVSTRTDAIMPLLVPTIRPLAVSAISFSFHGGA